MQARAVIAGKKAKEAHLVLAYHDQLLFSERRKVTEALNLETDLQKMISDLKTKTGKCNKGRKWELERVIFTVILFWDQF